MFVFGREWMESEREGNENWKERRCKLGKNENWEWRVGIKREGDFGEWEMVVGKEGIEIDS